MHHRGLVGGEVVADHVDLQALVGLAVDLVEEVPEVHRPMLGGEPGDHLASEGVQGGEQVDGAVPDVVETPPLGHSRNHRQDRCGPLEGLDLRLLVHREDDGVGRRSEVEADDVADLVDQERVRGDLERLGPPGLEAEGVPDQLGARPPTVARWADRSETRPAIARWISA